MPELPDIVVYLEALEARVMGKILERVRIISPFVLRSVAPPVDELAGREVRSLRRLGKQIVFGFDNELFLIIHLMIAGRLQWKESPGAPVSSKIALAAFDFSSGTLILTEAGSKKRASIRAVAGEANLRSFDRQALEVLTGTTEEFSRVLRHENHTVKRSLTDPRMFSGIGNAYSDEILHRAK